MLFLDAGERLTLRAWAASRGAWGGVRRSLRLFPRRDRRRAIRQIKLLVNRLTDPTMALSADRVTITYLGTEIPKLADGLTPNQLALALRLGANLAERRHEPLSVLRALGVVAKAAGTPAQYEQVARALELGAERLSAAELSQFVDAVTDLLRNRIQPRITLHVMSPSVGLEFFREAIVLAKRLDENDLACSVSILISALRRVLSASDTPEALDANRQILVELLTRIAADPQADMSKLTSDAITQLVTKAIEVRTAANDYRVRVSPERGHSETRGQWVREWIDPEEPERHHGDSWPKGVYGQVYREEQVYVVDAQQMIEVVPL